MEEREPTIKDVMSAVSDLAEAVNNGFQGMQEQFQGVQDQFQGVQKRFDGMRAEMATKDFVERRLERTDAKINMLVHVLAEKRALNDADRQAVRLA